MTWSVLNSESVLQLGMGERGLSHELILTIRLLMVSYGIRHYESVFLVFLVLLVCLVWCLVVFGLVWCGFGFVLLLLFFLSPCNDGCFCVPSLWLLSP